MCEPSQQIYCSKSIIKFALQVVTIFNLRALEVGQGRCRPKPGSGCLLVGFFLPCSSKHLKTIPSNHSQPVTFIP